MPLAAAAPGDDEDERPQYRPGLVAELVGSDGKAHRRVDELVSFDWGEAPPDSRLPPGDFTITWRGRLFSIATGEYQLRVFAAGRVKITLAGQVLLERDAETPQWLAAAPIKLSYGHHPLEIVYRRPEKAARIGLFWQGPKFALEPVPSWHLFHDPPTANSRSLMPPSFAAGERLAHALRCAACHDPTAQRLPAPALTRLAGNVDRGWLVDWIQRAGHDRSTTAGSLVSRMPDLGLTGDEAEAIAAYLLARSEATPAAKAPPAIPRKPGGAPAKSNPPSKSKEPSPPKLAPDVRGRELFVTLGCLACHQVGTLGRSADDGAGVFDNSLFGGGDLTRIADKRPAAYFARWLAEPAALNADHRMPVFPLSEDERADLAAYLGTLNSKNAVRNPPREPTEAIVARGKELVAKHNCQACHRLPDGQAPGTNIPAVRPAVPRLDAQSRWEAGCLSDPVAAKQQPGYRLSKSVRAALKEYFASLAPRDALGKSSKAGAAQRANPRRSPDLILAERNCLACHARGNTDGLAAILPQVVAAHAALAPAVTALKPPALHGVGDKLHESSLRDAILAKRPGDVALRPWLRIRMPRFPLADEETAALVKHFVDTDRIPAGMASHSASKNSGKDAYATAGSRLVTTDGFGCTSCHAIGRVRPEKDEIRSLGPDLKLLGQRVRREWYDRWMPNPARIVPNMEMPALVAPIRGVLHDRLDDQLAAVWHVLQQPDFEPPTPGAIRVVRCRNLPGDAKAATKAGEAERAHIITDVVRVGDRVFIKPLVIGLPNRHNILFDLETNQLAVWWIGDTARQYTRGKSWHWEIGGTPIFLAGKDDAAGTRSEFRWFDREEFHSPLTTSGQFAAEFESLEFVPGGVQFTQRLNFDHSGEKHPPVVSITQTFTAVNDKDSSGFLRRVEIQAAPSRVSYDFRLTPQGVMDAVPVLRQRGIDHDIPKTARSKRFDIHPVRVLAAVPGAVRLDLEYRSAIPVDRFPMTETKTGTLPQKLDVVAAYEAVRLPLPEDMMPTALTWREDGSLLIADLKGRVLSARDTNGDGLEDQLVTLADGLAAPYGLAANDGAVDVVNKHALLRLRDIEKDGPARRIETLASGWGHTDDYHDWAVGLPRDAAGNYYIALPCQQDDRSPAAARLRGKALKLRPRKPSKDDPRPFAIEEICSGLRFPMGLALNREGALFASDNQGNYNPFNELNHLRPGKHYGFINKLDFWPGVRPPLTPPAIDIPHPWTRSVNGICFLDTPPAARAKLGRDAFGPFEGHLIGCEYDTRRLIRFSLQRVGDTYQGAAYEFTRDAGGEPLAGPVCCAVSPAGDLVVGNLRDSGWGGGANVGSLVRLRPQGKLPLGIAEVRARRSGFEIEFTGPVDRAAAARVGNYTIASYRRESTPAYGGPDQARRTETIEAVEVSPDGRRVQLRLGPWREGFVYEVRANLAAGKELFHPAEAHYTLRTVPSE